MQLQKTFNFPDPRVGPYDSEEPGLLAIGGDLHPESLILAYRNGIFPWPVKGLPILWFCPEERGILKFSKLKINKTLRRFLNKNPYRVSVNQAFDQVIKACAAVPRDGKKKDQTWILPNMVKAYIQLHKLGYAHSVEVWEGEHLVGGLYGVEVDGIFSGESMFYLKSNASKIALVTLVDHLKKKGIRWIDIQMVTPVTEALGGELISRNEYLNLLTESRTPLKKLF